MATREITVTYPHCGSGFITVGCIVMVNETYKKVGISIAAGLGLLLLYIVIFMFSAQDAEESSSLSLQCSGRVVGIVDFILEKSWPEVLMQQMEARLEQFLRKLAHFSEYAVMGILVYALWRPWMERGKKLIMIAVAWVAVSAGTDEFHQLFVPGRSGNVWDVLLDTCGGFFGVLCLMLLEVAAGRYRKKR